MVCAGNEAQHAQHVGPPRSGELHCRVVELVAAGWQRLRAVVLAVLEDEHKHREQHRHAAHLLEEQDRALEHGVHVRVVGATKERTEELVRVMSVRAVVVLEDHAVVDL
eukprot:6617412-Prymnesium_polylepis.1